MAADPTLPQQEGVRERRSPQPMLLYKGVLPVAKIATFPTSLIYCDAVIKQLCYYDEKLTDAAFVKPINLAQAPDYLTHFPDGGVWLDRICEDLRDGKLLCIGEAIAKTFKVFDNALHYSAHNPENWAHHAATELRALLDRLIRENAGRLFHPGACAACLGTFCGGGMVAELKALQAHKKKPISPTRLQNGKKKKRRSAKRRQGDATPQVVPYGGLFHGVASSVVLSRRGSAPGVGSDAMWGALDLSAANALAGLSLSADEQKRKEHKEIEEGKDTQERKYASMPLVPFTPLDFAAPASSSTSLASAGATTVSTTSGSSDEDTKSSSKACTKCASLKRKLTRALNEGADLKDRLSASDRQVAQLLQDVQFQRTMAERYQAELLKLKAAENGVANDDDKVDAAPVPADGEGETPSKKRKVDAASSSA